MIFLNNILFICTHTVNCIAHEYRSVSEHNILFRKPLSCAKDHLCLAPFPLRGKPLLFIFQETLSLSLFRKLYIIHLSLFRNIFIIDIIQETFVLRLSLYYDHLCLAPRMVILAHLLNSSFCPNSSTSAVSILDICSLYYII